MEKGVCRAHSGNKPLPSAHTSDRQTTDLEETSLPKQSPWSFLVSFLIFLPPLTMHWDTGQCHQAQFTASLTKPLTDCPEKDLT